MDNSPEPISGTISGKVKQRPVHWIDFQMDPVGNLTIRTLYGWTVIADKAKAASIMHALTELVGDQLKR